MKGRMASAAASNGLQHVIWSTLEDTRQWIPLDDDRMPTLMEKYKVPHFDAKGEANADAACRALRLSRRTLQRRQPQAQRGDGADTGLERHGQADARGGDVDGTRGQVVVPGPDTGTAEPQWRSSLADV